MSERQVQPLLQKKFTAKDITCTVSNNTMKNMHGIKYNRSGLTFHYKRLQKPTINEGIGGGING